MKHSETVETTGVSLVTLVEGTPISGASLNDPKVADFALKLPALRPNALLLPSRLYDIKCSCGL